MKRIIYAAAAVAMITANIFAEGDEKLSLLGSIGFGVGIGGDVYSSDDNAKPSTETKYFNYGKGLKFDLGARFGLADNLKAQADFDMSFNVPKLKDVDKPLATTTTTTTYSSSMFGIKAKIVPEFEFLELINMYTGVGIGFYWGSLKYESNTSTTVGGITASSKRVGKYVAAPALGLTGFLGADFPLSSKLTLFGELGFDAASFKWKKEVIEESPITGEVGTHNFEKDDPNKDAPPKVPASNWQIRVGVRMGIL
jgi:opacity protein-like surface antigen